MARKKSDVTKPLSTSNYVILMLLAALVGVGITVLISKSLIASIATQNKVWTAKKLASSTLEENLRIAPTLVSAYEDVPADMKTKISNSLPVTDDYPNLIAQLENMARVNSVALVSVARNTASTEAAATDSGSGFTMTPQAVPVSLSVSGNFAAVQNFIAAMEKSARPMRVASMQLAGTGAAITAQIDATTYFQDKATVPYKLEELKK